MAETTLGDNTVHTAGDLPAVGSAAPEFHLTKGDFSELTNETVAGQRVVLNIFPSIDTQVCATSVRKFNERAAEAANTVIVCLSADLPFALNRFCGAEGISNVVTASTFRGGFDAFGTRLIDGKLAGLQARAVVVIDETGKVIHTELVPKISQEPNYDAALAALK